MIICVHFANERVLFKISSFLVEIQNIVKSIINFGHSQLLLESQRNLPYIAPFAIIYAFKTQPTVFSGQLLCLPNCNQISMSSIGKSNKEATSFTVGKI